jgi:membrane protein insertase Oxa1/YidC/SpoIIIJ
MFEILAVVTVIIIFLFPYLSDSKYREIERHQAMRRTMIKLREKFRQDSL